MSSQRSNAAQPVATGDTRKRPTRRERRAQAERNDWRAAIRDAAPLLRVRRACV